MIEALLQLSFLFNTFPILENYEGNYLENDCLQTFFYGKLYKAFNTIFKGNLINPESISNKKKSINISTCTYFKNIIPNEGSYKEML